MSRLTAISKLTASQKDIDMESIISDRTDSDQCITPNKPKPTYASHITTAEKQKQVPTDYINPIATSVSSITSHSDTEQKPKQLAQENLKWKEEMEKQQAAFEAQHQQLETQMSQLTESHTNYT